MTVFTVVGAAKKIMQFCIFVFEINLRGSKYDWDCIFLWELFSFYENVSFPLDHLGFIPNIFTSTPSDFFNWSSLINDLQLQKE